MTTTTRDTSEGATSAAAGYFESHAEYYAKSQYRTTRRTFMNARHDHIVSLLPGLRIPATASVLDAGCGPGNLVPEFAARYRRVVAMDMSRNMLKIARGNSTRFTNVTYQVGSIEALPYGDASFDVVCSAGVIEYLQDARGAVREMHRILKPGGLLILPTTNALAPAHWLRPVLEPIARVRMVARAFGIQPGTYKLWYHRIPAFKASLQDCGFALEGERHFYLTLPRPLDRMFPSAARRIEGLMDGYMGTGIRHLAEGYIAIARKA